MLKWKMFLALGTILIRGGGIDAKVAKKIDWMHKITEHKRNMPVVPEV